MMIRTLSLAAALALSLATTSAFAQAAPPAPATPAVPAATPAMPATPMKKGAAKPRTAQSLECSKKADAANVHGKPRKTFMSKCKAGKA